MEKTPTVPLLLKLYLVFHCGMIFSWSIPEPSPPTGKAVTWDNWMRLANDRFKRFAIPIPGSTRKLNLHRDYLLRTGLWQFWGMFAPNPGRIDMYLDQVVTFQDGSVRIHHYPRMAELSLFKRYVKERFRKFVERVSPDTESWKWPVFAQRIAYEEYTDRANPPVHIALRRHWREVQPLHEVPWLEDKSFTYFEYTVDRPKLLSAKRF